MRINEGLLQELDQEAGTTRRLLERVPQEHLEWRPHQKAMTLGQLATHVANIRVLSHFSHPSGPSFRPAVRVTVGARG